MNSAKLKQKYSVNLIYRGIWSSECGEVPPSHDDYLITEFRSTEVMKRDALGFIMGDIHREETDLNDRKNYGKPFRLLFLLRIWILDIKQFHIY